jgi:hypothetical protein
VVFRSDVLASIDHSIGGVLVTYIVFPMVLLASIELLGRMLQKQLRS